MAITKFLANPIDKLVCTQKFGMNPQIYAQFGLRGHNGLDFRTRFIDSPLGRRYVYAVLEGVCEVYNSGSSGYGLHVRITHPDGSMTIYGHLSKTYVFNKQVVKAGQQIGLTGNTGFSSAPHLHFEFRPGKRDLKNGFAGAVDPTPFFIGKISYV